jgi:hypothetical protein
MLRLIVIYMNFNLGSEKKLNKFKNQIKLCKSLFESTISYKKENFN